MKFYFSHSYCRIIAERVTHSCDKSKICQSHSQSKVNITAEGDVCIAAAIMHILSESKILSLKEENKHIKVCFFNYTEWALRRFHHAQSHLSPKQIQPERANINNV